MNFVGTWTVMPPAHNMGGAALVLTLSSVQEGVVSGRAHTSSSRYEPDTFSSVVSGQYSKSMNPGAGEGYTFTLEGHLPVALAGGPQGPVPVIPNLRVTLNLGPTMGDGTGSYDMLVGDNEWESSGERTVQLDNPPDPGTYTSQGQ